MKETMVNNTMPSATALDETRLHETRLHETKVSMTRVNAAVGFIKHLFAGNSGGHDFAHSMRVFENAKRLASEQADCDMEIVCLGALLHDADDHKLFETENNANARKFLSEQQVEAEKTEQIIRVINGVSFSKNKDRVPETIEGKIVQDADRLDAIGAIGIARTFAFGGEHGRELEDTVQHFYDKLLKLRELMNTEPGRKMADERHAFMEAFLKQLQAEMCKENG